MANNNIRFQSSVANWLKETKEDMQPHKFQDARGFTHKIGYINKTDKVIVVVNRQNMKFAVQPVQRKHNEQQRNFIIRHEFNFVIKTNDPTQQHLKDIANVDAFLNNYEIKNLDFTDIGEIRAAWNQVYKEFKTALEGRVTRTITFYIDNIIRQEDLVFHQELYVANQDVVLSIKDFVKVRHHPFCHKQSVEEFIKTIEMSRSKWGVSVDMVDNDQEFDKRWVRMFGQEFSVSPIKNASIENGIHIKVYDLSKDMNAEPMSISCPLNEAESYGFYRTREEAKTDGNAEMHHKNLIQQNQIKLNEQANELAAAKLALQEKEAAIKQETLDWERKYREQEIRQKEDILKLENENNRLKARLEERKTIRDDYYDERSHSRKDTSEVFKIIGIIGAAVLSLFAIFKKSGK